MTAASRARNGRDYALNFADAHRVREIGDKELADWNDFIRDIQAKASTK